MIITKNNYDNILNNEVQKDKYLSEMFLDIIYNLNIDSLNMASVGNSISSGYSRCDVILPLLMRTNLYNISNNINFYSYARIKRNEDYNILSWYNKNLSHNDMSDFMKMDLLAKRDGCVDKYWDENVIKNYYNMAQNGTLGFRDFSLQSNSIIIYNGFTGEFTNAFRNGKTIDKMNIIKNFKSDFENAKNLLTQIYVDNPHTQIYVCGLPNIMNTGIISCLDGYIKNLCDKIPSAIYLPGSTRSFFKFLDGQKKFDIHYSRPEYLLLINNLTESLIQNYLPKKFILEMLESLKISSDTIEKEGLSSDTNKLIVVDQINRVIEKYLPLFIRNNQSMDTSIDEIIRFYQARYSSTFCSTQRDLVINQLLKIKEMDICVSDKGTNKILR